ncbi:hypothetical protein OKW39_006085 [Paraburkholderia sp. MM6662-R1]
MQSRRARRFNETQLFHLQRSGTADRLRLLGHARRAIPYSLTFANSRFADPACCLAGGQTTSISEIGLWVLGNPAGFLLLLEGFPREMRGRSLGIIYSVGVTLFGGFAPFVVTWLIGVAGSAYAPAWYMSACSLVSLAALTVFDERITD